MIIGGAIHDFEHFAFNNLYLVESRHELALRYNDQSVLENHHIAASFALMHSSSSLNIFEDLNKDDYKRARELMISLVLQTDMAKHFGDVGKFKGRIQAEDFDPQENIKDKDAVLTMAFHLADISNTLKKWHLCKNWIELLFEEFFNQGDMEKQAGYTVGMLNDRCTVNVAKSQGGFIDFVIKPAYTALA